MDLQDVYEPWSSVFELPQNCDPADEAHVQIHVVKLSLQISMVLYLLVHQNASERKCITIMAMSIKCKVCEIPNEI
jgi:hypothetical protein